MAEPVTIDTLMKPSTAAKPADKGAKAPDAATPATPPPPGSRTLLGWIAKSATKKQLAVGASAVFSLAAGIAAVRLIWPAEEEKTPTATAQLLVSEPKPTPGPPSTTLPPDPTERLAPMGLPVSPAAAAPPGSLVPGVSPVSIPVAPSAVPPPSVDLSRTFEPAPAVPPGGSSLPPLPSIPMVGPASTPTTEFQPIILPSAPVIPAGGTETPPAPPPGPGAGSGTGPLPLPALPMIPTSPPATGGSLPMIPAGPSAPPGAAGPKLPPPPDSLDLSASTPKPPPATVPGLPVAPSAGGAGGIPAAPPKDLSAAPAGGGGTRLEFTKPPNTPTVTPATATERQPTTSYDVDIYEVKLGDTWESISREFYSDTKYAAALRAYNPNKALQSKVQVDVPPIHVLRRTAPQPTAGTPASRPAEPWGPVAASTSGAGNSYRVPRGGTSLQAVAKSLLKNEQRWRELYDLNPHIADVNLVPEGTEIKLPTDARGQ